MKSANPYLNFPGNTEEAFNHYRSILGGEFIGGIRRYREFGDDSMKIPEEQLDRIAHIALPLGNGNMLMGTDHLESWGPLTVGKNFYIALESDDAAEAARVFEALAAGGSVEMPLQPTAWAEQYGSCTDKFGVQWMVMYTGSAQL